MKGVKSASAFDFRERCVTNQSAKLCLYVGVDQLGLLGCIARSLVSLGGFNECLVQCS